MSTPTTPFEQQQPSEPNQYDPAQPQPQPQPEYQYQQQYLPAKPTTNVLAIIAFAGSFFISLLGIILGHIALSQIKKTGQKGRGFALAGLIIGYASVGIAIIGVIVGFATLAAEEAHLRADSYSVSDGSTPPATPSATDCASLKTAMTNAAGAINFTGASIAADPTTADQAMNTLSTDQARFNRDMGIIQDPRFQSDETTIINDLEVITSEVETAQTSTYSNVAVDGAGIDKSLATLKADMTSMVNNCSSLK